MAGHQKTIEEVRRDYQENEQNFSQIRGGDRCRFCGKYGYGFYTDMQTKPIELICDACLNGAGAQAQGGVPGAQAQGGVQANEGDEGEILDVPIKKETKKVRVTVQVRRNPDDDDFHHVHEDKIQKMQNEYRSVQRRNYFVRRSAHLTVGIQNLESTPLILQIQHVDENLDPGEMKTVTIQPNAVYELLMRRSVGEDRESWKIFDSSGALAMLLSFQEELPSRKRPLPGASADTVIDLRASLQSLYVLGQDV